MRFWYVEPTEHIHWSTPVNNFEEHALHIFMQQDSALLMRNPLSAPVGWSTHIAIQKEELIFMPQNGRGCVQAAERKLHLSYYYGDIQYSHRYCQLECVTEAMMSLCGCRMLNTYFKIDDPDQICDTAQALLCARNISTVHFHAITMNCRREQCIKAK